MAVQKKTDTQTNVVSSEASIPTGLVIEVKTEGVTKRQMFRKAEKLLEQGVRIVWLVFPQEKIVEVYAGDDDVVTVGIDGILNGGDVLPNFKLAARELFPD